VYGDFAMRGSKSGPKIEVDVGLSARASLEARISTEIPPQSTGRLVDAITDLIRPFSERQGLKADLIRLHREEVAIEIAKRARRRLEVEKAVPSPIPLKFLIPFLEKASLEDADSFLIDRWADLLVSSSMQPEAAHPRFVQILSELGAEEAKLLRDIALYKSDNIAYLRHQLDRFTFSGLPDNYRQTFARIKLVNDDPEQKYKEFVCKMMCLIAGPGISVTDVRVIAKRDDSSFINFDMLANKQPANIREGKNKLYVDLLCSLHLLNHYNVRVPRPDFESIQVSYVQITTLGLEFLRKCDRDIEQRFHNQLETVNRICKDEYCPKLYDTEWGRLGYKWWMPPDSAGELTDT
jgi:hypothetical protein